MARLTDPPPPGSPQSPGPPPPARSPFLPPAPRPPLPPADPRLRQRAWAALCLAVLSLLALMLIGSPQRARYVVAVALAVAVTALLLGLRTMSAARRAGTSRPRGALAGVILGVIGLLFSGSALLLFLVFQTQIDQYVSCMNNTSTAAGQQTCQHQLSTSISSR